MLDTRSPFDFDSVAAPPANKPHPARGACARMSDYKTSEMPAYQKMRSATHRFKETALYSFGDVAQIIGLTHEAVRKRAIIDQWPCVEIFIRAGRVRRPHFVPGEFLANLQLNGDAEK